MTIRELITSNSENNHVPSEIRHLVSDIFGWYEIQNYHQLQDDTGLRFFEEVNSHWVEVLSYAGCNGGKGIVLKRMPQRSGGGIIAGGTKRFAQMYINNNAQTLADGMGVSLKPKEDGSPRNFEDDGKEIFNYNSPSEKYGSDVVKASAAAAVGVAVAMALSSNGKSIIKDPDTLKTIREGFTGTIKGRSPVDMFDVPIKKFEFKKRNRTEYLKLQKEARKAKKDFNKSLVDSPEKIKSLKKKGLTNDDINLLNNGSPLKGYEVHHKLPLDDGGTNDPSNLVLIKKTPFHSLLTNEQNTLTKILKEGESKVIEFPIPKGKIYPVIK